MRTAIARLAKGVLPQRHWVYLQSVRSRNRRGKRKRDRVDTALPGELELLLLGERDRVVIVSDIEVWNHAQHALHFLNFDLLFRQLIVGDPHPNFGGGGGNGLLNQVTVMDGKRIRKPVQAFQAGGRAA